MPAWKVARNAGQSARQNQISERTKTSDMLAWVGEYDFEEKRCFFCRKKKSRLRTSYLAVTGAIWFCPGCKDRVEPEKLYEKTL